MKELLKKISYFLHISDGNGQLDIIDLAFIAVIIKAVLATPDWPSMVSLISVIAAKMHQNNLDSKNP